MREAKLGRKVKAYGQARGSEVRGKMINLVRWSGFRSSPV